MNRDAALEAAICAARQEDGPWLVYGDWLAERGADHLSQLFYALGGRAPDVPRTREALALAIATGLWATYAEPERDGRRLVEATRTFAPTLAQFALGGSVTWSGSGVSEDLATTEKAMDALGRGAFPEAARLARISGEASRWLRLLQCAARTSAPFARPTALAAELSSHETSSAAFDAGPGSAFSFEHVRLPNATIGLEGRMLRAGLTPMDALYALVLDLTHARHDTETGDALVVDVLEGATGWLARTPFECLNELFSLLAANAGHGIAVGKDDERPLIELLEELGPCLGGASSSTNYPFALMQFERGYVVFFYRA